MPKRSHAACAETGKGRPQAAAFHALSASAGSCGSAACGNVSQAGVWHEPATLRGQKRVWSSFTHHRLSDTEPPLFSMHSCGTGSSDP